MTRFMPDNKGFTLTTRRAGFVATLMLVGLVLAGCALIKVRQNERESMSSTVIGGHVSAPSPAHGPIMVAAYSKGFRKREVAHYVMLHDYGEFALLVGTGRYYVFAFCDTNRNLIYDPGEPAGQYGKPTIVSAPAGGVVSNIDIVFTESNSPAKGSPKGPIDWPTGQTIAPDKPEKLYSRLAGTIADLDDERFAEENGSQGFWEGVTFFKTFGGNIYFLEAYDPHKIPILFIHGAGGTPKGWQYFVEHIDRTRFQPWFFYYPTGARMRSMAYLLLWKLSNLQIKYRFTELYITAHSMGGLVARSFIMDFGREFSFVKLFIALSTPWGGDKMAEYGVKQSPAVIPCWIDMQPEGDFIHSLYREKMPASVDFYMFYGHRGNRNPFRSNNDGTITMSSLLDPRPQAEAKMNYAFDEDHASIIYSKQVVDQYNAIINSHYAKHHPSDQPTGGYVKVNFSYDYPEQGVRPWPRLVLRSADPPNMETAIALRPGDSGHVLGPFPCGRYSARITADSVKSQKKWVPLTIESRSTKELDFILTPDGTISGYITTAMKSQDRSVGMPSWNKRPEHNDIVVQSIMVTGPETSRTIHPLADWYAGWKDLEVSRTDYCIKGYLHIFGLPAGEYALTIKAQGHEPYVTQQQVIPGQENDFRSFQMTPVK